MKTVREWLMTIEDEAIRTQAIENMENHYRQSPEVMDKISNDLHSAIHTAFVWSNTKQGFTYWDRICDMARFGTLKTINQ